VFVSERGGPISADMLAGIISKEKFLPEKNKE
jgi:hypothetical protein